MGTLLFALYKAQEALIDSFLSNRFNVINKARQIGVTTTCAAYILWLTWFHKDKNVLIVSKDREDASAVVKKVRDMMIRMPKFLQQMTYLTVDNVFSLEFANGSRIKSMSTSRKSGRSEAVSLLLVDEAAHIDAIQELWTSIKPSVSTGGSIIVTSTPGGVQNLFHELCRDAMNTPEKGTPGLNGFIYFELPWNVAPYYDEEWFKNETKGFSPKKISQEYLCQFMGSGDTVLDMESLIKIGQDVIKGATTESSDSINKMIKIYRPYNEKSTYLLTGDTSRGDADDYTGFVVWEVISRDEAHEAATFKDKIPYDKAVDVAERLYNLYHNPLIAIESNFFGVVVIGELFKRDCDNIYYSQIQVDNGKTIEDKMKKVPGFTTSTKARDIAISVWERMFRENKIHISSKLTYDEFTTFIWKRTATHTKAEAQRGCHDDLVICSAIACYIINLEYDKLLSNADDLIKLYAGMMISTTDSTGHSKTVNASGEVIEDNIDKRKELLLGDDQYAEISEAMNLTSNLPQELKRMRQQVKNQKELEKVFGPEIFKG